MLKTPTRKKREDRDKRIHREYQRLLAKPGAMSTACADKVAKKFNASRATVYNINKRMSHGAKPI